MVRIEKRVSRRSFENANVLISRGAGGGATGFSKTLVCKKSVRHLLWWKSRQVRPSGSDTSEQALSPVTANHHAASVGTFRFGVDVECFSFVVVTGMPRTAIADSTFVSVGWTAFGRAPFS